MSFPLKLSFAQQPTSLDKNLCEYKVSISFKERLVLIIIGLPCNKRELQILYISVTEKLLINSVPRSSIISKSQSFNAESVSSSLPELEKCSFSSFERISGDET